MKQQRNILRRLAAENRGSGMVLVLISMACVTLMGAAMLSMSYTGLRIKAAQRQAEKDFYSAEAAMDQVRAGLQGMVSEAIGVAYKDVLIHYSDGRNVGGRFASTFVDTLKGMQVKGKQVLGSNVYYAEGLQQFCGAGYTVTGGAADGSTGTLKVDDKALTLKNVKVSYTAANDYVTEISTDLVIGMPNFSYVMSTYSVSGLPEHALIAKEALVQSAGDAQISIDGSAYAGKIQLTGDGSSLVLTDGTMVCAGKADVQNDGFNGNARFKVDNNAKLWAQRIVVNNGSSVELGGEVYVLDDLDLSGSASKATLRGSYYGFGDDRNDPAASSAILVNGRGSTLDMSDLNRLMLAGRSFISNSFFPVVSGDDGGTPVMGNSVQTLESVSVRSNQQMYLVPAEYLVDAEGHAVSNPQIRQAGDSDAVLTAAGQAALESYHAKMRPLKAGITGALGQQISYYFMEFQTVDGMNAYFEDYFAAYGGQVTNYLTADSSLNAKNSGTDGYTLRGSGNTYILGRPTGISFDCTSMRSTFNQLKKTLIDSNVNAKQTNPYDYIVSDDKVESADGVKEFKIGDDTVGLVTDQASYTVNDDTPNTVRLIIAKGDVYVTKKGYKGLIISGGTIDITGESVKIEAYGEDVVRSFDGIAGGNAEDTLGSYLLHGGTTTGGESGSGGSSAGWNLDKLVTYRNWTKNG